MVDQPFVVALDADDAVADQLDQIIAQARIHGFFS
jgi:hypothetical protein